MFDSDSAWATVTPNAPFEANKSEEHILVQHLVIRINKLLIIYHCKITKLRVHYKKSFSFPLKTIQRE